MGALQPHQQLPTFTGAQRRRGQVRLGIPGQQQARRQGQRRIIQVRAGMGLRYFELEAPTRRTRKPLCGAGQRGDAAAKQNVATLPSFGQGFEQAGLGPPSPLRESQQQRSQAEANGPRPGAMT